MALTVVNVLWCGQGMTGLVEVYDSNNDKSPPDFLALVDCGGNQGAHAVDYIVEQVTRQPKRHIGLFVVSHQDHDHVCLLTALGPKLKQLGATVGKAFMGGLGWSKSHQDTVRTFLADTKYGGLDKLEFGTDQQSNYKQPDHLGSIAAHGGVHFRVLIANVPGSGNKSMQANTPSAVVVVDDGRQTVVLPGDATFQTMHEINGLPQVDKTVREVVALEVPHHGALRTAMDNAQSGAPDGNTLRTVRHFARNMHPQRIVASAGPDNKYRHPAAPVLDVFTERVTDVAEHWYRAFDFHRDRWSNYPGKKATYCTVQYLDQQLPGSPPITERGREARLLQHQAGKLVVGDVVFRMAPKGVLRPEQVAEFRPVGIVGAYGAQDVVLTAPAP